MRGRNLHNRLVALETKAPAADDDRHFGGVPFDKIYDHLQLDELDELKILLAEATAPSAPEGIDDARICEILNLGIERFRRGDEPIIQIGRASCRERV
jgi:hypothetical protein